MKATFSGYHGSAHLQEADLLEETEICPLCLSVSVRQSVFRVQDSPQVDLLQCDHCGGCSASRMPRADVLDRLYAEYYSGKEMKVTQANVDRFADHIARRIGQPSPELFRILDFGGGDGKLASKLAARLKSAGCKKVEIQVVDYQTPGDYATDSISIRGARTLEEVTGPFDLVVASAVLEHIPAMNSTAAELFKMVRPGGYFYARTPYMLPMTRVLKKMDLDYPFHVHDLGIAFWNRITKTFELPARIIDSGPSPVETSLAMAPGRTIAATLLKLPARIERLFCKADKQSRLWKFVGAWEVFLRFEGGSP